MVASVVISTNLNAQTPKKPEKEETKLESLAKFTRVITTVESSYADKLTFSEIINKAISGLMTNLDAHSSFLDEKAFEDTKVQTQGEFGGLGITVGMKDGALTVISPIEGTPADKAGVKSNDVILRIDGNATLGITLEEAVSKMRGKPKTPITITIVRKGEPKPFDIKIIRDIIKVDSVYAKNIEDEDILYLRVTNFDQKVTKESAKFIKEFTKKNKNIKGIILDLRNNPGGLLDQAIGLTNLFVDKGVIVSQKGRDSKENLEYSAKKDEKITDLPLVVLVNSGSASASEIVSGALQDLKRAVVIGEETFGKGSVQVILPLNEKEALKMTIARYYLPSGRTIQNKGVTPDLEVFYGKVPNDDKAFSIKETDLKQHLENELQKIDDNKTESNKTINLDHNKTNTKEKDKEKIITTKDLYGDMQLKTAVDTIKVLNLTKDGK
ncbi:S41 family peptidase [Campylobacter ureolyticus]|uniref:S41 family peptidase n=1 Tax=Campylobacter ureolyticus TaxID=827 RepID=A0A9Q4KS06_9BACT|nr:S41 family peptidase [Campylobacter ureolyticus]MCZ6103726.1 S41 family peptidase [Campylobacter ureolyticus]MCZ6133852.1 S41 family peptidase [Campylobacter ureolyticus]MCZ6161593.1 S41 family peptidase [Campylobacter ureolyticus]MCZ6170818.1 S41 family peptidase [Campylobacter ureolyticus]